MLRFNALIINGLVLTYVFQPTDLYENTFLIHIISLSPVFVLWDSSGAVSVRHKELDL